MLNNIMWNLNLLVNIYNVGSCNKYVQTLRTQTLSLSLQCEVIQQKLASLHKKNYSKNINMLALLARVHSFKTIFKYLPKNNLLRFNGIKLFTSITIIILSFNLHFLRLSALGFKSFNTIYYWRTGKKSSFHLTT